MLCCGTGSAESRRLATEEGNGQKNSKERGAKSEEQAWTTRCQDKCTKEECGAGENN